MIPSSVNEGESYDRRLRKCQEHFEAVCCSGINIRRLREILVEDAIFFPRQTTVDFLCSNPCRQSQFWKLHSKSDHPPRAFALQCVATVIK